VYVSHAVRTAKTCFLIEVSAEEGKKRYDGQDDVGYEGVCAGGEGGCEAMEMSVCWFEDALSYHKVTYIRPTATSSTLSRSAKLLKLSHAPAVLLLIPCSASRSVCSVFSSRRGIIVLGIGGVDRR
jgi:hypothetical protein